MQRSFEYKTLLIPATALEHQLNYYGQTGWRVVTLKQVFVQDSGFCYRILLEREHVVLPTRS
jgi:hypothetical protein